MQIRLTPDYSLLIVLGIFLLNYVVVRRFFIKPINRVMMDRESDVRRADELYEAALNRFNDAMAAVEEKLHSARKEGAGIREALRSQALEHREKLMASTRAEAESLVDAAQKDLLRDVEQAKEKIVEESEVLARMAAERLLQRKVS